MNSKRAKELRKLVTMFVEENNNDPDIPVEREVIDREIKRVYKLCKKDYTKFKPDLWKL